MTTKNFRIIAGDDKLFNLFFTKNQVAHDISGWLVRFRLYRNAARNLPPVLSRDITDHDDAPNGKTQIKLSHDETGPLLGLYFYNLLVIDPAETVTTLLTGRMVFAKA